MRIGYPMLYFLKFKDLTCNFCAFSRSFYFLVSFYPIWMKILSKFRENVGLQAYRLGSVLNWSWTSLRTAVFSGLSQKNWEDRDCWSAWTGYSPVRFSVPFRSYEPDLEALPKMTSTGLKEWERKKKSKVSVGYCIIVKYVTALHIFLRSDIVVFSISITTCHFSENRGANAGMIK